MHIANLNDQIAELNRHPMNVVALELLQQAGSGPSQIGALAQIHLLSFVLLAMDNDDGNGAAWARHAQFSSGLEGMEIALAEVLNSGISIEDLRAELPFTAAEQIAELLRLK